MKMGVNLATFILPLLRLFSTAGRTSCKVSIGGKNTIASALFLVANKIGQIQKDHFVLSHRLNANSACEAARGEKASQLMSIL